MLSEREKLAWLRLIRTPNIGPVTFRRLIDRYGAAGAAINALPDLAKKAGRRSALRPPSEDKARAEWRAAERAGASLIFLQDADYPVTLRDIHDPPPVLFVRGNPDLFSQPAVAIVGARNASAAGRTFTRSLSRDLGETAFVIVSGLARGIDGAAHEAALATGTIAVVAGGVDVVYPPEHRELMAAIAKSGLIVSENPPGMRPTARDFPRRNRLIAGLSRGVVVVEAAARSGTLITARFALEQGREVFAVPGSPLDPRCEGANRLLKEGAGLVENARDVTQTLDAQLREIRDDSNDGFGFEQPRGPSGRGDGEAFEDARAKLRQALSFTPVHRDTLMRELDCSPGDLADALLDLVIAGEAEELPGGRVALKGDA